MERQLAALDFALGMEKEGKAFFEKAAGTAKDPGARRAFKDLAVMEEGHIAYIKANIESLAREGRWTVEMPSGMAQQDMGKAVFQDRGEGRGPEPEPAIGERTTDLAAIRIALAIENDLQGFYMRAAENSDDPGAKVVFTKLSEWEKGHKLMLEAQYEEMKEGFWSEMGFSPF